MLLSFFEHLHSCTSVMYKPELLSGQCRGLCTCHELCPLIFCTLNLTLPCIIWTFLLNPATWAPLAVVYSCCEQNMHACLSPLTMKTHKASKRQLGYVQYVRLFQPCWTDLLCVTHRLVERSKNGRHKMLDRNNRNGRLFWKPRMLLTLATHILGSVWNELLSHRLCIVNGAMLWANNKPSDFEKWWERGS